MLAQSSRNQTVHCRISTDWILYHSLCLSSISNVPAPLPISRARASGQPSWGLLRLPWSWSGSTWQSWSFHARALFGDVTCQANTKSAGMMKIAGNITALLFLWFSYKVSSRLHFTSSSVALNLILISTTFLWQEEDLAERTRPVLDPILISMSENSKNRGEKTSIWSRDSLRLWQVVDIAGLAYAWLPVNLTYAYCYLYVGLTRQAHL